MSHDRAWDGPSVSHCRARDCCLASLKVKGGVADLEIHPWPRSPVKTLSTSRLGAR